MKKFTIMADTTCDLTKDLQEKYDIVVIQGHITTPDKGEMTSFQEWDVYDREEFYAALKKDPAGFSTAPPNIDEFANIFEEHIKQDKDVILLTISGGMSGTYNFATTAKQQVLEKYPDAKITVIDSLRFGPVIGLMAINASIKRANGKSYDEVCAYLEDNKNRYHQAGWLDDLSFIAKKGRLTHAKAFFGTLAGVKPIGEFDYNGMTTVLGKAKGAKAAYAVLLQYIEATIEDPENQIIFIAQSARLAPAEAYKKMIEEKFHPKEIIIKDVFPSTGINVGPGLMAAYYYGKPISKDLGEERALIEKFLG